jgi:hypothetical protein
MFLTTKVLSVILIKLKILSMATTVLFLFKTLHNSEIYYHTYFPDHTPNSAGVIPPQKSAVTMLKFFKAGI